MPMIIFSKFYTDLIPYKEQEERPKALVDFDKSMA
jgi:hypothetical protein